MEDFNVDNSFDRHRKKRFYNSIRDQIEFYLGDVNLSKDRFFSKLLEESPYIEIETILQCNKIKKLTSDPKDIVKALKKSSLLSVTEDQTKIYRTVPVAPIPNADDCTIYVEDLPMEVDHDWLKNVFSLYGEVVYVSVPTYKTTRKIKGFAFVQFDSSESATKAIRAFQSVDSCLSCSTEPTKLRSIQTYEGEKDVVVREHQTVNVENLKSVKTRRVTENEEEDVEPQRKRRKRNKEDSISKSVGSAEEQEKSEKEIVDEKVPQEEKKDEKAEEGNNSVIRLINNYCNKIIEDYDETMKVEGEIKFLTLTSDIVEVRNTTFKNSYANESDNSGGDADNSEDRKSKRRKRKKAKKSEQVHTHGMQILSKKDWKKLRNKYLEEQRKRMHELKQQLRMASTREYEKSQAAAESENEEEKSTSECRVKFTPGVIVKLPLDQHIKDVKSFKNEVKRYADVEYIDVKENDAVAFVRCSSNEAANQLIALNKWQNMLILQGDEELAYWEKIKLDRKEKIENKIRTKTRGKNKLIKKVEAALATHIKFPD